MGNMLSFNSLDLIEIPIKIADRYYILKELKASDACKWRDAQLRETKLDDKGKIISFGNQSTTDILLLSLSMFEVPENASFAVPIPTINSWPYKLVKQLVDTVKEMNELEKPNEKLNGDVLKNELSITTDGSG